MSDKRKIPEKIEKALSGFEDILDLIDTDKIGKGGVTKDNLSDNFNLYHFLESELTRLKKIDNFFMLPLSEMLDSEAQSIIVAKLKDAIIQKRSELTRQLRSPSRPFLKQINQIWDASFR